MPVTEIEAKSLLRKQKRVDSWFLSRYGMNLYRGCAHDCAYCDGRAEKYRVEGEFGKEVAAKINAPELLELALDPARKRKPVTPGFIVIGGGVGDSYQPAESKYQLARKSLEIIDKYGFPVHVLTKSTLVERDLDLLSRINEKSRAIVSMSLSSADDGLSRLFEPGCAPPSERLATLRTMKKEGITTGVYLMPVIPFISDTPPVMEITLDQVKEAGVDFVMFGGMTLKDGRQKTHFLEALKKHRPQIVSRVEKLYPGNKWGNAGGDYYERVNGVFGWIARQRGIPRRIPSAVFRDVMDENDRTVVILDNLDYLCRLEGKPSPYRTAAWSVSQLDQPLSSARDRLRSLKGVGAVTERIILEILDTGTSSYHDRLL